MIVYLDTYASASHRAFFEGWSSRSCYDFELVRFPGRHWKWRMRHGAISAAHAVNEMDAVPDAIVSTTMINLAELRGLLSPALRTVPLVAYCHENQPAYPVPAQHERDEHFAMTNLASALACDAWWCNSRYNLDSMLDGLRELLRRMPAPRMLSTLNAIPPKASVLPPGIDGALFGVERAVTGRASSMCGRPMHLLWNARWEYDKGVDILERALLTLLDRGVRFTCDLVGPAAPSDHPAMLELRDRLGSRVEAFGELDKTAYRAALARADVVVSCARHEFFGLAVLEAVASGALPVVPDALAYPEVLGPYASAHRYDGSPDGLVDTLCPLIDRLGRSGSVWDHGTAAGRDALRGYAWETRARALDASLARVMAPLDPAPP